MAADTVTSLNDLGVELHEAGLYREAIKMYNTAMAAARSAIDENRTMGVVQDWTSRNSQRQLGNSHGILEPFLLGEDHADTVEGQGVASAVVVYNASLAHASLGNSKRSLLLLQMSFDLLQSIPNDGLSPVRNILEVAVRYNMGLLYYNNQWSYEKAIECVHHAIVLGNELLQDSAAMGSMLHTVAHMLLACGRTEEAEVVLRQSLHMFHQFTVGQCSDETNKWGDVDMEVGAPAA